MIEIIQKLLALDPEATCSGGDVTVYRDGVHTSYGRTISTESAMNDGSSTFQLTPAGQALIDAADVVKTKRPRNVEADPVLG